MADTVTPQKNRGGRPRVPGPRPAPVTAWIPGPLYDRITAIARSHDLSVSAVVRRTLIRAVRDL